MEGRRCQCIGKPEDIEGAWYMAGRGGKRTNIDVTDKVRSLCQQKATIKVCNETFGKDPEPGTLKFLFVETAFERGHSNMLYRPRALKILD
jgi:hypothetical protein